MTKIYTDSKSLVIDRSRALNVLRGTSTASLSAFFLGNIYDYTTDAKIPPMALVLYRKGLLDRILSFKPEQIAVHNEMYEDICIYTEKFLADIANFGMDSTIANYPNQLSSTALVAVTNKKTPFKKNKLAGSILKKMDFQNGTYTIPGFTKAFILKHFINRGVCPVCLKEDLFSNSHKCDK